MERATARYVDTTPHLDLNVAELEELLVAVGDREDTAGTDARARLLAGRRAIEAELGRRLAA